MGIGQAEHFLHDVHDGFGETFKAQPFQNFYGCGAFFRRTRLAECEIIVCQLAKPDAFIEKVAVDVDEQIDAVHL